MHSHITRRQFTARSSGLLAATLAGACFPTLTEPSPDKARLHSRPTGSDNLLTAGFQPLGLSAGRDGLLYVPPSFNPSPLAPAPLLVLLHGAGGSADDWQGAGLEAMVDQLGIVVLCPSSRDRTWDFLTGGWGPDVQFIDAALARTFQRVHVDPARVALGGFSDGASYALSLGIFNGDLFSHLIGFSPGFLAAAGKNGDPRIFVMHGTEDPVLPIGPSSRRIVDLLQKRGYDVTYTEFAGVHEVTDAEMRAAATWFVPLPPNALR